MDKIEKIRQFVKELQQDFISIQPKDCSLELIKSYAGYAYLDKVLSFLDTLSEELDKSLEEAAEDWVFENCFDCDVVGEHRAYDAFIAGAEWQASQMPMPEDTVLFNKGVGEGRRLEREDMLKDAVEVEVVGEKRDLRLIDSTQRCLFNANRGDWLRIVVLKAEEE